MEALAVGAELFDREFSDADEEVGSFREVVVDGCVVDAEFGGDRSGMNGF